MPLEQSEYFKYPAKCIDCLNRFSAWLFVSFASSRSRWNAFIFEARERFNRNSVEINSYNNIFYHNYLTLSRL